MKELDETMVERKNRVVREPLDERLATSLLNTISIEMDRTIGSRLGAARMELAAAIEEAREELRQSPLTEIVAEHAVRQLGRRGHPDITVDDSGQVVLELTYNSGDPAKKTRKTRLPPIEKIRAEARRLGIDPEPFGKSKRGLIKAIGQVQAEKRAAKQVKTAPAIVPPKQVRLDGDKVIPIEDDDIPVASLFADQPGVRTPPPKKAPPPRRGTPGAPKKRSLSDIVTSAEDEVDIDAIMSKPAPKRPENDDD